MQYSFPSPLHCLSFPLSSQQQSSHISATLVATFSGGDPLRLEIHGYVGSPVDFGNVREVFMTPHEAVDVKVVNRASFAVDFKFSGLHPAFVCDVVHLDPHATASVPVTFEPSSVGVFVSSSGVEIVSPDTVTLETGLQFVGVACGVPRPLEPPAQHLVALHTHRFVTRLLHEATASWDRFRAFSVTHANATPLFKELMPEQELEDLRVALAQDTFQLGGLDAAFAEKLRQVACDSQKSLSGHVAWDRMVATMRFSSLVFYRNRDPAEMFETLRGMAESRSWGNLDPDFVVMVKTAVKSGWSAFSAFFSRWCNACPLFKCNITDLQLKELFGRIRSGRLDLSGLEQFVWYNVSRVARNGWGSFRANFGGLLPASLSVADPLPSADILEAAIVHRLHEAAACGASAFAQFVQVCSLQGLLVVKQPASQDTLRALFEGGLDRIPEHVREPALAAAEQGWGAFAQFAANHHNSAACFKEPVDLEALVDALHTVPETDSGQQMLFAALEGPQVFVELVSGAIADANPGLCMQTVHLVSALRQEILSGTWKPCGAGQGLRHVLSTPAHCSNWALNPLVPTPSRLTADSAVWEHISDIQDVLAPHERVHGVRDAQKPPKLLESEAIAALTEHVRLQLQSIASQGLAAFAEFVDTHCHASLLFKRDASWETVLDAAGRIRAAQFSFRGADESQRQELTSCAQQDEYFLWHVLCTRQRCPVFKVNVGLPAVQALFNEIRQGHFFGLDATMPAFCREVAAIARGPEGASWERFRAWAVQHANASPLFKVTISGDELEQLWRNCLAGSVPGLDSLVTVICSEVRAAAVDAQQGRLNFAEFLERHPLLSVLPRRPTATEVKENIVEEQLSAALERVLQAGAYTPEAIQNMPAPVFKKLLDESELQELVKQINADEYNFAGLEESDISRVQAAAKQGWWTFRALATSQGKSILCFLRNHSREALLEMHRLLHAVFTEAKAMLHGKQHETLQCLARCSHVAPLFGLSTEQAHAVQDAVMAGADAFLELARARGNDIVLFKEYDSNAELHGAHLRLLSQLDVSHELLCPLGSAAGDAGYSLRAAFASVQAARLDIDAHTLWRAMLGSGNAVEHAMMQFGLTVRVANEYVVPVAAVLSRLPPLSQHELTELARRQSRASHLLEWLATEPLAPVPDSLAPLPLEVHRPGPCAHVGAILRGEAVAAASIEVSGSHDESVFRGDCIISVSSGFLGGVGHDSLVFCGRHLPTTPRGASVTLAQPACVQVQAQRVGLEHAFLAAVSRRDGMTVCTTVPLVQQRSVDLDVHDLECFVGEPQQEATCQLVVRNRDAQPHTYTVRLPGDVSLSSGSGGALARSLRQGVWSVEGASGTLAAGEVALVSVIFSPAVQGISTCTADVVVDETLEERHTIRARLRGVCAFAILSGIPSAIDFGSCVLGQHAERTWVARNTGKGDARVSFQLDRGPWTCVPTELVIATDSEQTVTLVYTPTRSGNHSGEMQVFCNSRWWSVSLQGCSGTFEILVCDVVSSTLGLVSEGRIDLGVVPAGVTAWADIFLGNLGTLDAVLVSTTLSDSMRMVLVGVAERESEAPLHANVTHQVDPWCFLARNLGFASSVVASAPVSDSASHVGRSWSAGQPIPDAFELAAGRVAHFRLGYFASRSTTLEAAASMTWSSHGAVETTVVQRDVADNAALVLESVMEALMGAQWLGGRVM